MALDQGSTSIRELAAGSTAKARMRPVRAPGAQDGLYADRRLPRATGAAASLRAFCGEASSSVCTC